MTEEQIKFILECVNFYKKNADCKIYTRNDIKNGKPTKPISCYVIVTNYSNSNLPHVYYGGYDGNKFLSCHVSNPNIITREEYDVLGYIEYKYMTKDELMTREEQIKAAAKKTIGLFSYRNGYSTAEDAFIAGAKWADANPCMPGMVVNVPERSREEIKELLDNWKGTIVAGGDISISPWISVEDKLPELNKYGESKMVFVRVINKDTKAEWIEQPAKYNINIKDWIALDFTHIGKQNGIVTHWMPIPELPKEEKK